jgi:MFS family permease
LRNTEAALVKNRQLLGLPRTVVALGLVSLFTDFSSEMIVPLLPVFLTVQLGASVAFFGLIEGVAETVASLLKLVSGVWSDRLASRRSFVLFGYTLSALMRPLMAWCTAPWQALVVRSSDRVGKGLRSAPRDALIVSVTAPQSRGWAFGFHRAMDHAGAMLGAVAASLFLAGGFQTRSVFLIAAIPGVFAVVAILMGVKSGEPQGKEPASQRSPTSGKSLLSRWPSQPPPLKRYLGVLGLFTLANSSDAFLLLKAHDSGIPVAKAPILWLVLHLTKAVTNLAGGRLSDKVGPRRVIGAGWLVYGLVYLLFGWSNQVWQVWTLFALYGLYYGLAEGAEKALISEYTDASRRGEAFGLYYFVTGLLALPASVWMGFVWDRWGSRVAFFVCAGFALTACALFYTLCKAPQKSHGAS